MPVIGLPAIPGFASGNWRLERSQSVAFNPFGKTRQRTEFDGAVWRCALGCPKYNDEDAAVFEAWQDQVSEAANWLYVSPPQNELRGAWALPELVSNGTFIGGVTTGWAGTGATLGINSRRLKVKNSGAAIGYARQTLAVTADVPYVLLVDIHAGSTQNWRIRLLDGADVEEHVSYYATPGRVPIVHIPASGTLKVELGCNTAVAGDDVKFSNITAARCLLVDDSLAVGNELKVKGGPASVDGAIKGGQFVTVRLWNGWQMMRLKEDFDTDSAGKGTLKFTTSLRDGVLGGGPVVVHAPFMRATLDAPVSEAQLEPANFKGFSLDALEDPTVLPGEVPQDTDLIWAWFADSLGLAPTVGTGTPTLTRADATATYTDSDGLKKVAAANAPRFNFDPVTKAVRGLLIESSRTNLIWPSADFTHANHSKSGGITITQNVYTAPDGSMTMDQVVGINAVNDHVQFAGPAAASAGYYTYSVWLAGAGTIVIQMNTTSDVGDNQSKTVTLTSTPTRYSVTCNFDAAATGNIRVYEAINYAGTTTTVYIWGAQLEAGSFPSSYIPTTTAAVGRNVDACSVLLSLIGFSASAVTVLTEWSIPSDGALITLGTICSLDDGTLNERVQLGVGGTGAGTRTFVSDGGIVVASEAVGNGTSGSAHRSALAVAANDCVASFDGTNSAGDLSVTMPSMIVLTIGSSAGTPANILNGHLRRLGLYKTKKPRQHAKSLSA